MTRPNYTHVTILIDRSGSMSSIRNEMVYAMNKLIREQQELPGECTMTIVQFDSQDPYEVLRDFVPVKSVALIGGEYQPRGGTPLYDAQGRAIHALGARLTGMLPDTRPSKVVFVTVTDGYNNASTEYTQQRIKEITEHQRNLYGWEFVYLGANQDALAVGDSIGIATATSGGIAPTSRSLNYATQVVSSNLASYRAGTSQNMDFSQEQSREFENLVKEYNAGKS